MFSIIMLYLSVKGIFKAVKGITTPSSAIRTTSDNDTILSSFTSMEKFTMNSDELDAG